MIVQLINDVISSDQYVYITAVKLARLNDLHAKINPRFFGSEIVAKRELFWSGILLGIALFIQLKSTTV